MSEWIRERRRLVAGLLFAGTLAALVPTLDDPGITWDEPDYFGSAQLQARWVGLLLDRPGEALTVETIREMWDWRHHWNPHPPVYREGMALTWSTTRSLLGSLAAFRLFPALCFAGLVATAFLWGTAAWGGVAGLASALSIALTPRLWGHAHIAATETPLTAFWFASTAAGWWAVTRERRAGWVLAGAFWGLAAGTKFTGVAAVMPLAAWALWRDPRRSARGLAVAVPTAVIVFVALNPLVWIGPADFLTTWVGESLGREEYAPITTEYLGRLWGFDLPWHHVFVMTVAVIPIGILAMAGLGTASGLRRGDPTTWLAAGTIVFVQATMLLPDAPHHNGVRLFLHLFPFVGLLAGAGIERARRSTTAPAFALVAALVFVPPLASIVRIHPFELSYYGEAVGGVRGAAARGLETAYWMETVTAREVAWMNAYLPEGATVYVMGSSLAVERARAYRGLRADLRLVEELPADYLMIAVGRFRRLPVVADALRGKHPVYRRDVAGVPMIEIYRLRMVPDAGPDAPEGGIPDG